MLENIALRAVLSLFLALCGFGAWRLIGLLVLHQARRAAVGMAAALDGFVRGKPGLLVFGSPRCAPCVHAQRPAARRLEAELLGAIQLLEVDVTERPELAERFGVVSLPTVFIVDAEGEPRRVNHGLVSTDELRRQISPFLA
jgi:thioredoxin-like negative regulator of GroEL